MSNEEKTPVKEFDYLRNAQELHEHQIADDAVQFSGAVVALGLLLWAVFA